ncbi:MAG: zinc-ribbon domain-containing protein [Desulfobacterales bacterium]
MTVICEECGKVYHIDPDKLDRYKGKSVRVRCGECGHVTEISKLFDSTPEPADDFLSDDAADISSFEPEEEVMDEEEPGPRPMSAAGAAEVQTSGWLGLRGKMMVLFLVLPILLMAISGYISQQQLNKLANEITDESTALVLQEGKEKLMRKPGMWLAGGNISAEGLDRSWNGRIFSMIGFQRYCRPKRRSNRIYLPDSAARAGNRSELDHLGASKSEYHRY